MKKKILIIISLIIILVALTILLIIQLNKVKVSLIGSDNIQIEYGEEYQDEGVLVKKGIKKLEEKDYKINILSKVDSSKLGKNEIKYKVNYKNKDYELTRYVEIVDNTKPQITLNTNTLQKDYCTRNNLNELKYEATDNYDGNLTESIVVEENEDKIILKVKDSNGNEAQEEIKIEYTEKPKDIFSLNGNEVVYIAQYNDYNEEGAKLTDGCGNQLEADIKTKGEVNTSQTGDYYIEYELEGYDKLSRKVNVYEVHYDPKTIFLTFDDGPGAYTRSILDTLAKHNVKATFFVTNQFPNYQSLIGDEHNQGHTVAVHTYSHNYNVYSSVDTYINDFNQMNEIIKNYTGSYSNQFRFPGGSSNTVSRSYSIGVVSQIANEMTRRGYIYYDWNVDSRDAEGVGSDTVYNSVINGTNNCTSCVVLMHDIKASTAEALDRIITTLKQRGYTFAPLTTGSPTSHHGINN